MPARQHSASARRGAALLAAACLSLGLAACGADNGEEGVGAKGDEKPIDISGTDPLGQETAGSVAPLVQCRDWVKGTKPEKLATIDDIRNQLQPGDTGIDAPPLSDDEALEVFDNACAEDFAAGFRLYGLYARAAGFAPLTRDDAGG